MIIWEKRKNFSKFVAMIIFLVETIVWAIEFATNSILEIYGYDSSPFVRGLGLIVATLLLIYFVIDSSKGIIE